SRLWTLLHVIATDTRSKNLPAAQSTRSSKSRDGLSPKQSRRWLLVRKSIRYPKTGKPILVIISSRKGGLALSGSLVSGFPYGVGCVVHMRPRRHLDTWERSLLSVVLSSHCCCSLPVTQV